VGVGRPTHQIPSIHDLSPEGARSNERVSHVLTGRDRIYYARITKADGAEAREETHMLWTIKVVVSRSPAAQEAP
jgi:hypothetical protein